MARCPVSYVAVFALVIPFGALLLSLVEHTAWVDERAQLMEQLNLAEQERVNADVIAAKCQAALEASKAKEANLARELANAEATASAERGRAIRLVAETERLRIELHAVQEKLAEQELSISSGGDSTSAVREGVPCEDFTFYMQPSGNHEEMDLVRHELEALGWKPAVGGVDAAQVVLDNGHSSPEKHGCRSSVGLRLRGSFGAELALTHKSDLKRILGDHPGMPTTWVMDDDKDRHALQQLIPCTGPVQEKYLVKGNSHGGRAVWLFKTFEELRRAAGLPCKGAEPSSALGSDFVGAPTLFDERRIVQEVIKPLKWPGGRRILSRSYFYVLRRGETLLCATSGRQLLGRGVSYELYGYEDPFFVSYEGLIQDRSEATTLRLNRSEFDAGVARLGGPFDYVDSVLNPVANEVMLAAWEKSEYPTTDLKRYSLEPDGSYMGLAAEFLIDNNFKPKLIEFTSHPQVTTVLRGHPGVQPMLDEIGASLTDLLLTSYDLPAGPNGVAGPISRKRWKKVGKREAFPHP